MRATFTKKSSDATKESKATGLVQSSANLKPSKAIYEKTFVSNNAVAKDESDDDDDTQAMGKMASSSEGDSSNWSAKDSIDLEIKAKREMERENNKKKRLSDKPLKLMIEKEIKKGELLKDDRQKLKAIVSKGKTKDYLYQADTEKVAKEIMDQDRMEAAGLDSSFNSGELDEELRDRVEG